MKKTKKTKPKKQTLQLADFLDTLPSASQNVNVTKSISWGDECEQEDIVSIALPTAPRSTRVLDDSLIPQGPPYLAYMTNLPYDLNEEDLQQYFEETLECEVVSVRLPRDDKDSGRMRGFGYVEFKERQDLIDAVSLPDPQIRNRRLRIDISNENDQRRGNSRRGYDNFGQGSENRDTNWRRDDGGRSHDDDQSGRRGGYNYGNRDRDRQRDQGDSIEDGNWRSGDRPEPESPPPQRRQFQNRGEGENEIYCTIAIYHNFISNDSLRIFVLIGDRGERGDRGDRGGDRGDRGYGRDRFGGRRNNGFDDRSRRDEPAPEEERPRLHLEPRTLPMPEIEIKPDDDIRRSDGAEDEVEPAPRPKPVPVPAAAIFGSAKPVDTAAKDRLIEERLERERQEKIKAEQEEREKKEKAAAEEREKAEQTADADADAAPENDAVAEDAEKPVAPVAAAPSEPVSWRTRNDSDTAETSRTQSPPRSRHSPSRRPRRNFGMCDIMSC